MGRTADVDRAWSGFRFSTQPIGYPGYLTTRPCTDEVDWFVVTQPVEVDVSVVAAIRQAMAANARP